MYRCLLDSFFQRIRFELLAGFFGHFFSLLLSVRMYWLKYGYKEEIDGFIKEILRTFLGQVVFEVLESL